jgi:hypothetical protein
MAVVQEPLHSRLSMEGGNIPIAAALHPDSPSGNLRKASAALMLESRVDSCRALLKLAASSNMPSCCQHSDMHCATAC